MSCDCEYPKFFNQTIRKARKSHKCCECSRPIDIGDKYDYSSGKWDDFVGSFKTCLECSEAKIWLDKKTDCCVAFGELRTELIESGVIDRVVERIYVDGNFDHTEKGEWFVSPEYVGEIELISGQVRLKK